MTDASPLPLAAAFESPTREAWLRLVEGVLKGADVEKRLVGRTYDGLRIEPLYPKAEPPAQPGRAAGGRWRIAAHMDHPDPVEANRLALADLEGGADALVLTLAGAPTGRGFGVGVTCVDDLDRALDGVMLDLIHLAIETAPFAGREAATQVLALVERRRLDPATLSVEIGLDPAGDMARTGRSPMPFAALMERVAGTLRLLREGGLHGPQLRADGRPYHEAGASEAGELAAVLATGVAYLRGLEANGIDLDEARRAIAFTLVADADEFLTIAKLRAFRRLWARAEAACGLAPEPVRLTAETAWRMTTRADPWVNMLRASVAVFSAGVGGADIVSVLPFTAALGLPDAFARRVARNTQLVLMEEGQLWRVADPAAGAGGFEALTDALAATAWSAFQEIEREGGIAASLSAGALQGRIAAVREERARNVARRRDPITGTSEFPDIAEAPVDVLMPAPVDAPSRGQGDFPALRPVRAAEPFERLRAASDAWLARTGARPRVFLAGLGPVAAFTARATFAKNFFEAGGIEATLNGELTDVDSIVTTYLASGAKLACLCSTDETYVELAIDAVKGLKQAGCGAIYSAGRATDIEADLRAAGLTSTIHAGCDALGILDQAHETACRRS
ncbi:methylmalonyl-CoA mutase family protein [Salinarimonas soli]|uniref:Methylmalonyl-CoA mutase n=1 Tax=Salinarimonas soli TaxID=1638099 RepID=A0A5B2VEV1_9HYPH|nr:methylmalonyl-CoA mutase family protein [Salinarimonas soli]KAA2237365.1 methylmalonyl-CoA mutase [Salinarimonas soli]